FALILAEALIIAGLFLYISSETLTTGYSGSSFVIDKTSSFFLPSFIALTVIVGLAVGIAGIFVFIFISHSIAGPLFRFETVLRQLTEGDFRVRVQLRKTDQLSELLGALNKAIEETDTRLNGLKVDIDRAYDLASGESKEALAAAKDKLDFFKTA
ncbi:MAG: HAMP domain-containing protein, partial [Candidatus Omnitrophota bacterium]